MNPSTSATHFNNNNINSAKEKGGSDNSPHMSIRQKFQQLVLRSQTATGLNRKRLKNSTNMNLTNGTLFKEQPKVDFDDFRVIRIIGRGSFGKVCLGTKESNRQLYAMKCICKESCMEMGAVKNIIQEVDILKRLDHPFVVRLFYTFQDDEDLFLILEPLLGGDLRYHLQCMTCHESSSSNSNQCVVAFDEEQTRFITAEIACALNYIHSRGIIHRDVKPDNILLDDQGHARLTDFNVSTTTVSYCSDEPFIEVRMQTAESDTEKRNDSRQFRQRLVSVPVVLEDVKITIEIQEGGGGVDESKTKRFSIAGTAPYMAPEIYNCALTKKPDYSSAVDWWSLGVTAYELIYGTRPYPIEANMRWTDIQKMFHSHRVKYPCWWSPEFTEFIKSLLNISPSERITNLTRMKKERLMSNINLVTLSNKQMQPPFTPDTSVINCDPTLELEEFMLEVRPLHKKKKNKHHGHRGSGSPNTEDGDDNAAIQLQNSAQDSNINSRRKALPLCDPFASYPTYNREWHLYQQSLALKEVEWEKQLEQLMTQSDSNGQI